MEPAKEALSRLRFLLKPRPPVAYPFLGYSSLIQKILDTKLGRASGLHRRSSSFEGG